MLSCSRAVKNFLLLGSRARLFSSFSRENVRRWQALFVEKGGARGKIAIRTCKAARKGDGNRADQSESNRGHARHLAGPADRLRRTGHCGHIRPAAARAGHRKGIGTARWLPAGSVRLIGRRCVLAGAKPGAAARTALTDVMMPGVSDHRRAGGAGKRRAVQRANASAGRAGNYAGAGLRASRPLRLHRFLSGNPRGKASWAGDGLRADDMGGISGAFQKGGMGMSAWKAAVAGAVGFAVGAGAMLMPGNQKMKKQVQKQVDKLSKMAKMW